MVDDGYDVRVYNLVDEFSSTVLGFSNKESTKIPKKVKNRRPKKLKV